MTGALVMRGVRFIVIIIHVMTASGGDHQDPDYCAFTEDHTMCKFKVET